MHCFKDFAKTLHGISSEILWGIPPHFFLRDYYPVFVRIFSGVPTRFPSEFPVGFLLHSSRYPYRTSFLDFSRFLRESSKMFSLIPFGIARISPRIFQGFFPGLFESFHYLSGSKWLPIFFKGFLQDFSGIPTSLLGIPPDFYRNFCQDSSRDFAGIPLGILYKIPKIFIP